MRYFKLDELGKHPLTLADLAFMQEAYQEALQAIVSGLGDTEPYYTLNPNANDSNFPKCVVLSNCRITQNYSNLLVHLGGYVAINGEIYTVDAASISLASANILKSQIYWQLEEIIVAPSPVTYQNLQQKNVHIFRKAKLTTNAANAIKNGANQPISYANTETLRKALLNKLNYEAQPITLHPNWVAGNNPMPNPHYKVEGNRCFLYGDVRCVGTALNNYVGTIAPLIKPKNNGQFLQLASDGKDSNGNLQFNTAAGSKPYGWVYIDGASGNIYADPSTGNSICLDGISFELEPIANDSYQ